MSECLHDENNLEIFGLAAVVAVISIYAFGFVNTIWEESPANYARHFLQLSPGKIKRRTNGFHFYKFTREEEMQGWVDFNKRMDTKGLGYTILPSQEDWAVEYRSWYLKK